MGVRFDKVLEQVARAGSAGRDSAIIESRERKVHRLEELIRAREAMGDRIVMCLGLALTLSAIGLPVYAVYLSDGYSYLQTAGSGSAMTTLSVASLQRSEELSPATTGSLKKELKTAEQAPTGQSASGSQAAGGKTRFQRYVIHRATSESALIEGPEGLWWVTPGMKVPGIGQVISIERSENGWAVLTSEALITQPVSAGPSS
jgi:hypothetical protein